MKNPSSLIILTLCTFCWHSSHSKPLSLDNGLDVELIDNGTTYKLTSMQDGMVITVLPGGTVITDEWKGHEEQKWTIFEHPRDHLALVFVNYAVPYNDLSGYEELEDNPGIFPRPLTLNKHRIMPDLKREHAVQLQEDHFPVPWQIIIRNRWCLQNNGQYRQLDIDDCEYDPAPWQYWELSIVPLGQPEDLS
ncbi:uncharacterized protein LOC110863177 [Folsomia candida]|uniref:uncharacterized protein LOC110863177 n=1 Tax=Folsomia candida TaxID=158441 RepID=UPI000B8FE94A|nr:uncharacterized protein LOC110863177 [Folsomia candida]